MIRLVLLVSLSCAFAKPGFDGKPALSLNSIRYQHEQHREFHLRNGIKFVDAQKSKLKSLNTNVAKNAVLFLGDGMSVSTLAATRVYIGGEEKSLSFEEFPFVAMSKTYCVDKQVADSACSASAYLTGVKGNYGTIGVSAQVKRKHCKAGINAAHHTQSIAQWALNAGKSIGLVTTTRVTHASPAGFYAHTAERDWENNQDVLDDKCDDVEVDDIAEQLVYGPIGQKLKVIFGGGRRNFFDKSEKDEQGNKGKRTDDKNLIEEWLANKRPGEERTYVYDKHGLLSIQPSKNESVLGLFASGHLEFNHIIDGISDTMPTLKEMTMKAIEILSTNPKGFFLFVEGGRIDSALHENHAHIALEETAEFSRSIEVAKNMLSFDDTLFVVTTDHSHTMTLSGYPERGSNIFGVASRGDDDATPYLKLSFANGPGFVAENRKKNNRTDPSTSEKLNNFSYLSPATVPLADETHGGDDVVIFAAGPHSHLFSGSMEQHTIPHFMGYATCIGDGITHCNRDKVQRSSL